MKVLLLCHISTVTGKRKRTLSKDDDENMSVMDNVGIEKAVDNSIAVVEEKEPSNRDTILRIRQPCQTYLAC